MHPSQSTDILGTVRGFVLKEFLPGEDESALEPQTPLVSSGILDSISTLKLVGFLEEEFGVEMEPHELAGDALDTLEGIETLVRSKLPAS